MNELKLIMTILIGNQSKQYLSRFNDDQDNVFLELQLFTLDIQANFGKM